MKLHRCCIDSLKPGLVVQKWRMGRKGIFMGIVSRSKVCPHAPPTPALWRTPPSPPQHAGCASPSSCISRRGLTSPSHKKHTGRVELVSCVTISHKTCVTFSPSARSTKLECACVTEQHLLSSQVSLYFSNTDGGIASRVYFKWIFRTVDKIKRKPVDSV